MHLVVTGQHLGEVCRRLEGKREYNNLYGNLPIATCVLSKHNCNSLLSSDFCNLCTSNKQHFTVPYHIKEYANQVSQSEVSSHFIV